jgi:hypothetical protein
MLHSSKNGLLYFLTIFLMAFLCMAMLSCSKNGAGSDDDDDNQGEDDNTPPVTVADLKVDLITTATVTLSWTSPGDDGLTGWCFQYDFRGSTDSITNSNFAQAYKIEDLSGMTLGGTHQIRTLDSLESGTTYYFAFKARDDMGNWSGLSNCVRAQCITNQVLIFDDSALETVVRNRLNRPTGDIWISDIDTILEINGDNAGIADLDGLQFFAKLSMLHLADNAITDLTPLSGLINLTGLHLRANLFTDISPLAGLTNLEQISTGDGPLADISPIVNLTKLTSVNFGACQVTDFTPLQSLTNLEYIYVANNHTGNIAFITGLSKLKSLFCGNMNLTDISPLVNHPDLEELSLGYNSIIDISALSELIKLTSINLQYNQIIDIAPLVNNSGLGTGDQIRLEGNPLSDSSLTVHIPTLESRGVTVTH